MSSNNTSTSLPAKTKHERIEKAIAIAVQYGGIDGAHHKDWCIDQMVRALTGCPVVLESAVDCHGNEYVYELQGESKRYKKVVAEACAGEDGPHTYSWDEGCAP